MRNYIRKQTDARYDKLMSVIQTTKNHKSEVDLQTS